MSVKKLINFIEDSAKNPSSLQLSKIQKFARNLTHVINDIPEGYTYTACHAAVKAKDFATLEILVLEGHADLSVLDTEGCKPKDYAPNVEFKVKMSALHAEQMRRRHSQGSHLHDLIRLCKKTAIKERIASHPLEINETTYCQRNAGHIAALYYPKCMKWLVSGGLDLRARDNKGDTCLPFVKNDRSARKKLIERYEALFLKDLEETQQLHLLSVFLEEMKKEDNIRKRRGSISAHSRPLNRSHSMREVSFLSPNTEEVKVTLDMSEILRRDSLSQFRAYVRDNKPSKEELLSLAIQNQSVKIVVWLLEHTDVLAQELYPLKIMNKDNAAFWFAVNKRINRVNSRRKDDEQQKLFEKEEMLFNCSLIEHGLTTQLSANQCASLSSEELMQISERKECKPELIEALYEICSGIACDRANPQFNALQLNHMALGLLNLHTTKDIFKSLSTLVSHFWPLQKWVALYVAKVLLCNDHYGKSYLSKRVCMQTLNNFFEALELKDCQEFNEALLAMAQAKRRMHNPLTSASIYIQSVLSECGYRMEDSGDQVYQCAVIPKFYNQQQLAQDCRAISLSFYQRVNSMEFGDKLWQKADKHRTSPNIVNSQKLFDNLQEFIVCEILKQKNLQQRIEYITMLINTIELLLEDPQMPDLNSAMAILSALQSIVVFRLKSTFASLAPHDAAKLERFKAILDSGNNFAGIRQIMRDNPKCLPFLGVYLKDFNACSEYERLSDTSEYMGAGFQDLAKRQSRLANINISSSIGLLPTLQTWQQKSEDELLVRSHRLEGGVVFLDEDTTIKNATAYLEVYVQTQFPLRIFYKNTKNEGEQTIETLFVWLRDFVVREDTADEATINNFITLIGQLKQNDPDQIVSSEQHAEFMVWYAQHQTIMLVPQFIRLTVNDPVDEAPIEDLKKKHRLSAT